MFREASHVRASDPPPLWAENRVWASGLENRACIGASSWISSTAQWSCGQIYDGTAVDRPVGLDYFGARYFSAAQGRFTSPDWSATPQAIPYGSLGDPQTLNLYSYVRNNPLSKTDPDGHCFEPGGICSQIIQYVAVHVSSTGTQMANTRAGYNAANKLTFTTSGRDLNKIAARGGDAPLGRGLAEMAAQDPARVAARAAKSQAQMAESISRTSSGATQFAEAAGTVGKVAGGIAVVAAVADVAMAPEGQKVSTAVGAAGGLAGAWAGGESGALAGAAIGSVFPGPGTAIGAAVGGFGGAIGGGLFGNWAAKDIYNSATKPPDEKKIPEN